MKRVEQALGVVFTIGYIMRLLYIPGHSITVAIPLSLLALIYFYLGFALFNGIEIKRIFKKESYKEISVKRILGSVFLGIGLSTFCVGMSFLFVGLPGAIANILVGLVISIITLIVTSIKLYKTKDLFYKNAVLRTSIISGLGFVIFMHVILTY